jgi:peptidoglycan-associated lipoprotein
VDYVLRRTAATPTVRRHLFGEDSMSFVRALLVSAVAFAGVVVVTGCPGPEYPKCESDDQCKKNKDGSAINEYCVFGQCQECAKDVHCGAGKSCNKGRCEETCAADDQCGDGQICEARRCVTAQCKTDDACGDGQCQAGRCAPKGSTATGGGGSTSGGGDNVACEKRPARVQFDYNASDLRPDGRAALDALAKCLVKNADWKVTVEGHCDDRGTPEYNLSLGEQRAKSVRAYLKALGVDDKRVRVVTFGEEKPLDAGQNEDAWAKNRRGEVIVN